MRILIVLLIGAAALSGCGEVQISINTDKEEQTVGKEKSNEINSNKDEQFVGENTEEIALDEEHGQTDLSSIDKQNAIIQFINEDIQKVAAYEIVAFKSLASVSGENYSDDHTLYTELINTTIPAYEKALEQARGIKGEIPELEEMTGQIVVATQTFYDALLLEKKALEDQDEELIQKSNDKISEYYRLVNAYHSSMKELAEKHNVTYQQDGKNLDSLWERVNSYYGTCL